MVAKKARFKPRMISVVTFVASLLSFLVTTFVDERVIFNRFFSNNYSNVIAAKQKLIAEEVITSTDRGFREILPFIVDAVTAPDQVKQVKVMGEGIGLAAPLNISNHIYWFFEEDNRKIGENDVKDLDLDWRIKRVYHDPPMNRIIFWKSMLQFILGAVLVIITGIEAFMSRK
jgi:hypothetical protein